MSQYILRFSVTAFIVWVLQLLPTVVRMANPPQKDIWKYNYAKNKWVNIARRVFQIVTAVILLFAVHREKGDMLQMNSWLIVAIVFLLLYYMAWMQYFQGKASPVSLIFGIALMKPLYLIAAAQCLNNSLVVLPCILFGVLHVGITAVCFCPRRE
ncbi:MAG: hypothetical protein Q4F79_07825 [Eubacteriales bacterium]|nr:hypothetical protein [Eubacteriales bacterium]